MPHSRRCDGFVGSFTIKNCDSSDFIPTPWDCLAAQHPLQFRRHFKMSLSTSAKKSAGILVGTEEGCMAILTLGLPVMKGDCLPIMRLSFN